MWECSYILCIVLSHYHTFTSFSRCVQLSNEDDCLKRIKYYGHCERDSTYEQVEGYAGSLRLNCLFQAVSRHPALLRRLIRLIRFDEHANLVLLHQHHSIVRMPDIVKVLGAIFAFVIEQDFLAAGMLVEEVVNIVYFVVQDDQYSVILVILLDFASRELPLFRHVSLTFRAILSSYNRPKIKRSIRTIDYVDMKSKTWNTFIILSRVKCSECNRLSTRDYLLRFSI